MAKENMTRLNPIEETPDNSIFLSEKMVGNYTPVLKGILQSENTQEAI